MQIQEKSKISRKGLNIILILMVVFFLGIILYTFGQIHKDSKSSHKGIQNVAQTQEMEEVVPSVEEGSICVLKEVDLEEKKMILYDITKDSTVKLSYTGSTDIKDEYSQIITAAQLILGDIVEAVYDESTQSLKALKNSSQNWEYSHVTGLNPDIVNKIIKLYGQKYRYTSKLYVRTQDGEGALLSINAHDVLTVRGYEQTIYSITVTRGHGSIALSNADYFEGAMITIDGKDYNDISADMVFTVREGTVELTVEKGNIKETTTVNVVRNEQVVVDLSMFAPEPEEKGLVTFVIEPFGAELYIDGELTSYANPLEITYGEHEIEVMLHGYEPYYGAYLLGQPSDVVQIVLPETLVEVETDSETTTTEDNNSNSQSSSSSSSSSNSSSSTNNETSNNETSNNTESDSTKEETGSTTEDSKGVDTEHTITIKAPQGVSVYINGNYKGITPLTMEKPLGITYITLLKEGYEQMTHTVNISDDQENKVYSFPNLVLDEEE